MRNRRPAAFNNRVRALRADIAAVLASSLASIVAAGLVLARRDPGPAP
jgi:hypothetical protein